MVGKKGRFGFREGVSRMTKGKSEEWFDPASFLLKEGEPLPQEEDHPHFILGKLLLIALAFIIAFRLTNLQIVQGNQNRYLAEGNRIRRLVTVSPRGAIVDRKSVALVSNEPGYSVELVPSDLPRKSSERDPILQSLADSTHVPLDKIKSTVTTAGLSSLDPVTVVSNVPREEALAYRVKFATLPGVRISYAPTRRYDTTFGLAHLLGYTSEMTEDDLKRHPDYALSAPIGRSGLESSYDDSLRGDVGLSEVEINANGQLQRVLETSPPKVGKTLRLTLDQGLQEEMAAALNEAMSKNGAKQAVGIAMDPRTGGILASVSLPGYDNNLFSKGISAEDYQNLSRNPDKPLLNRAVDGLYPAGSTIKPFIASAALQEGTITPATTLDTSIGVIKIGQWQFPDWKVHGTTDVKQAIAESNDIFFYALGGGWDKVSGLGVDRLRKYLHMFGFGQESGLDYSGEHSGLIPDPEWKKRVKKESWYIGDTYHMAIGQGDLLVTPVQLARALSSLVNGGNLTTPHLVDSIEDTSSNQIKAISLPTQKLSLSPDVIKTVMEGMHRTVASDTGSARTLRNLPFSSGGKTGTAQFGTEQKTHAWYIGFAPFENPEIVTVVIVEGGGEGNAISVPVASRVFSYYMSHK